MKENASLQPGIGRASLGVGDSERSCFKGAAGVASWRLTRPTCCGRPLLHWVAGLAARGRPELQLRAGGRHGLPDADGLYTKSCGTCCKGRPELLLGAGGGRGLPAADGLDTKSCRTCCKGRPELPRGAGRVALHGTTACSHDTAALLPRYIRACYQGSSVLLLDC
jgi:hypothetical protein